MSGMMVDEYVCLFVSSVCIGLFGVSLGLMLLC